MSRSARLTAALLAVVGLLVAAAACDKVPLLAPTSSTITLTSSTTTVPVNGTATVIASVTESAGTPVQNGTVVTFTSSLGTMDPAEARTEGGKATAIFRAGSQSGTASITAFSGATRAEKVDLLVGGAAAEQVAVRTEPSTVPSTGGSVQVIAIVTDASGNPLPGAPVVFTTDNGTLGANSGVTDENGRATTTLITNRETVVRASVGTKEGTATVRVVSLPSVTISTSATNPAVGSSVVFTITPGTATTGNPIRDVTVDFGDGTTQSLGPISSATSASHVYDNAGTYTVRASITDTSGQTSSSSTIVVVQRPVLTLTLTGPSAAITAGDVASFTVNAQSASGNPPIVSVVVTFPDGTSITLGPGSTTFTRTFETPGTYVVRATATDQAGTTQTASTAVVVRARTAITVTLDATAADASTTITCLPALAYPKTCTTTLPIFVPAGTTPSVKVAFTATTTATSVSGYTWSFGDGTSRTTTNPNTDKTYTARGTYVVTVTVTTTDGATGSQQLTLVVQ
ncbi:MAG: PKD domain-containing protein [Vicinamibacterales bacterium]